MKSYEISCKWFKFRVRLPDRLFWGVWSILSVTMLTVEYNVFVGYTAASCMLMFIFQSLFGGEEK